MRDVGAGEGGLGESIGYDGRHELHVAFVPDPALLPVVVEGLVVGAVVIDEVGGAASAGQECGNGLAWTDDQGRGAVAGRELEGACGFRAAFLGADDEYGSAARECRHEGGRAGALRGGNIEGGDAAGDVEGLGDDAGVEAVAEREGGGGKLQRLEGRAIEPRQAIARGLDGHRDRVLVPIADGALAFRLGLQGGIEPAVGSDGGLTLQAQARNVGAEGKDAGHALVSPCRCVGPRTLACGARERQRGTGLP